jgi:alginate O-acetyltransferase complex protein AlgI
MLFNSFAFLVFFLCTFTLYYIPVFRKIQVILLIGASLVFYGWGLPQLLWLLIFSIAINSFTSFAIAKSSARIRIFWATAGVIFNLLLLISFKYGELLSQSINQILASTGGPDFGITVLQGLPLPIGISFYTFEGISLLVDVLRQKTQQGQVEFVAEKPEKHLLNTALFIAFFPHLIAGPILKANQFYPQIQPKYFRDIEWRVVFHNLVVGFFLKMVIADNLKDYTFWLTYPYYKTLSTLTGTVLVFGYSMQIFADFAGYSLIAIGLGAALGYTLPPNFNFPYISRSISEFWRRWHISLSTWLKDYLYIPLGGNRRGKIRTYLNLMIVMLLGGLWHGGSWSYAVWGGYHGLALMIERFINNRIPTDITPKTGWQKILFDAIKIIAVFCFVTVGWLLFKLPNFGHFLDFIYTMSVNTNIETDLDKVNPIFLFSIPIIIYHGIHLPQLEILQSSSLYKSSAQIRCVAKDIALGMMLTMILLNSGSSNEFIYFQF